MITALDLEPIKTALAAGDGAGARRLRVQLLHDMIDELFFCALEGRRVDARGIGRVVSQLDALGIPDE